MKFKNKTFLITGAKQGMGYEIAKKLHSQGAKLILNDKESDQKFDAVCKEFHAEKFVCDLSQIQNIKQELAKILDNNVQLDGLVAQHAYMNMRKFAEHEESDWWKIIETNLMGTFVLIRECVPHLLKTKGKIVITSSYWGLTGWPEASAYASSKAGLISLVKSLGRELAPLGINVNAIAPGVINTPQLEVDAKNLNLSLEKILEMYAQNIPLGRVGRSEEIASVVSFLLDPDQNALVGQVINANGGEVRARA